MFFDGTTDWTLLTDLRDNSLVFPSKIAVTAYRPDIVVYSMETKRVGIFELTVPYAERVSESHKNKMEKYRSLVEDIKDYDVELHCIEVSTTGYRSVFMDSFLNATGLRSREVRNKISDTALRCSYYIYLWRNTKTWNPPIDFQ